MGVLIVGAFSRGFSPGGLPYLFFGFPVLVTSLWRPSSSGFLDLAPPFGGSLMMVSSWRLLARCSSLAALSSVPRSLSAFLPVSEALVASLWWLLSLGGFFLVVFGSDESLAIGLPSAVSPFWLLAFGSSPDTAPWSWQPPFVGSLTMVSSWQLFARCSSSTALRLPRLPFGGLLVAVPRLWVGLLGLFRFWA